MSTVSKADYYLKRIGVRAGHVAAIAGVLSLLLTIVVFLFTGPEHELVVWIETEKAIFPSETTAGLSLPLSYQQTMAKSATFVILNISNGGKTAIGQQTEPWTLQITSPAESTLVVLDASNLGKAKTVVSPLDNPAKNAIALHIGLLDPRAAIQLRLLVLNSSGYMQQLLHPTSSLKGLPQPLLTFQSPGDRIANKLILWLWLGFAVLLSLEIFADYRRKRREDPKWSWRRQILHLAWRIPAMLLLSGFVAGIIGKGIGWLIAELIEFGVFA